MVRPTKEIRTRLQANLIESRQARKSKDYGRCWSLLEDAHVLSQPWALMHISFARVAQWAPITTRDLDWR